jgi:multicomponent Na+:H+ antiporter subunit E
MRGRPSFLASRWWMVLWLTAVWIALWGELTPGNVLVGLLLGSLLLVAFPTLAPGRLGFVRPLKVLRFGAYFAYKLVEANVVVAWEVVTPSNESVNEGIVAVPVSGASDAVITLVANAITLTPGTMTLEVRRDPATLFVHVLHLRSIEETRREVRDLERRVLEAFGSPHAIARMEERHADLERTEGDHPADREDHP